jgi:N-hydroxyarylamine O-acetyltransferase
MDPVALDAYFARLGVAPPRAATLDVAEALLLAQLAAIPFENLDSYTGRAPELSPAALSAKLVAGGRGGYCFEQNRLLWSVLDALGFRVRAHAARVLWRRPAGPVMPRTHLLLAVEAGGETRFIDAGFGGLAVTTALAPEPGQVQSGRDVDFRLDRDDGEWTLQARLGEAWEPLYRFDLQCQQPADCEAANWYVATHPASPFTSVLMAARFLPDRRLALRDREFSVRHADGRSERRVLPDGRATVELLARDFGLAASGLPDLAGRIDARTGVS